MNLHIIELQNYSAFFYFFMNLFDCFKTQAFCGVIKFYFICDFFTVAHFSEYSEKKILMWINYILLLFVIFLDYRGMRRNQSICPPDGKPPAKEKEVVSHPQFRAFSDNSQVKSSTSKQKANKHFERKPTSHVSRKKNQRRTGNSDQQFFAHSPFSDKKGINMESAISMKSLTKLSEGLNSKRSQSGKHCQYHNEDSKKTYNVQEKGQGIYTESFKTRKQLINELQKSKQENRKLEKTNKILSEKNQTLEKKNKDIKIQFGNLKDQFQKKTIELQQVKKRQKVLQAELSEICFDDIVQEWDSKIDDYYFNSDKSSVETHSVDMNFQVGEIVKQLQSVRKQYIRLRQKLKVYDIQNLMVKRENYTLAKDNLSKENENKKLRAHLKSWNINTEKKYQSLKYSAESSLQFSIEN